MRVEDIAVVASISDAVHGAYTEWAAIYAERLMLYPAGCFLFERDGGALGYLISHPWRSGHPPALNRPIGAIPAEADLYYLHDLALARETRGTGAAQAAVRIALERAQVAGFARIGLTAVNGADGFWRQQGFQPVCDAPAYGGDSLAMERLVGT
nr:GNAT family N-acetyltransferase [Sphingobium sp. BYY-5]